MYSGMLAAKQCASRPQDTHSQRRITKCSNRYIKRVNKHRNPLITKLLSTSDQITKETLSVRPKHKIQLDIYNK